MHIYIYIDIDIDIDIDIYVIMKTMCPPGYHHNGFVATHALGHMIYGYTLLVPMKYIYIYIYIFHLCVYICNHM